MSIETIEAIKKKVATMQRIEAGGFSGQEKAAEYFREKEILLEDIAKSLETVTLASTTQIEALEATVKNLRDELKSRAASPRELTRRELCYRLGKGLAAAWARENKTLADLGFSPNTKSENWTNPRNVEWGANGWREKAALGSPMGDLSTNDQYLINPVYETEIMQDAAKQSVMMKLVKHRPMTGPSVFLPTRERGGVQLQWLTAYGQQITGSKPAGAQRVELKAYTLAGFIPWYDEFEDDVFADLGSIFIDEFTEAYAKEFDKQCLTANAAPFTGALNAPNVTTVTVGGTAGIKWQAFRDAVYKVSAEERQNCAWFLNETVLNHIVNITDSNGNPLWRRPMEAMPGKLDLYPYHECSVMPQLADIAAGKIFAVFMNPKRIQHGERKGIEIKKFDGTSESLEHGELFLRFRKRDGFLVTLPKDNIVVLKA
jgi:HK97 family phage major capsid protein